MADDPKMEETKKAPEEEAKTEEAPKEEAKKEEAPKEEPKKEEPPKEEPKKEEKPAEPKKEAPKAEKAAPVELSKDAQKIMDLVEKLPVMEMANLVKALEEKFGVTAAAPVMAAAGGGAGGGDAEDVGDGKKTVVLASAGGQKIAVIKAIREITGLGLKEAKDLVDAAPKPIKEGIEPAEAEEIKKKIEETGATVELQ
jgi:large subunit ribosomal protein L7/L12